MDTQSIRLRIANRLRIVIKTLEPKMSIAKFGRMVGLQEEKIYSILHGKSPMDEVLLQYLSKRGVSLAYLYREEVDNMFNNDDEGYKLYKIVTGNDPPTVPERFLKKNDIHRYDTLILMKIKEGEVEYETIKGKIKTPAAAEATTSAIDKATVGSNIPETGK